MTNQVESPQSALNEVIKSLPFGEAFAVYLLKEGELSQSSKTSLKEQMRFYISKNKFFDFLMKDTKESCDFLNELLIEIENIEWSRVLDVYKLSFILGQ